ncbi:uncharacterized protein [Nicotiana tomentosiformis]|uniref:uncharacterized protein n=1 Tax=Nicotiana tomentosiformis TaxID=4098 RepID=UPI00388C7264
MDDLEAQLEQYEQDRIAHRQEAAQLQEDLKDAKAKWAERHDTVITVAERESAFIDQVNNLKASLHSKIEKANVVNEKRTKMEERLKRVMEHNQLHSTTNVELDSKISIMKAENDKLKSKIENSKLNSKTRKILSSSRRLMPYITRTGRL